MVNEMQSQLLAHRCDAAVLVLCCKPFGQLAGRVFGFLRLDVAGGVDQLLGHRKRRAADGNIQGGVAKPVKSSRCNQPLQGEML